ncbi:hypothetical protein ACGFXC_10515 [Streptomyces sp. NPDC048507]|uniref:hypothetical protein n=1 Tax=Streptomyces sp. NPDC048507 TaxID=3365560 RepID=UPI0037154F8A
MNEYGQNVDLGNADDFLMEGGVGSAKFLNVGDDISGTISEKPFVQQQRDFDTEKPAFWDDGTPKKQVVVTLQTDLRDPADPDDDGRRRLYLRANMKKAVQQAVKAAGAKGLAEGGTLSVRYTGDGPKTNPKYNAPKLYEAKYTPPAAPVVSVDDAPTGKHPQYGQPRIAAGAAYPAEAPF